MASSETSSLIRVEDSCSLAGPTPTDKRVCLDALNQAAVRFGVGAETIGDLQSDTKHIDNLQLDTKHIDNLQLDTKHIDNLQLDTKHIDNLQLNAEHFHDSQLEAENIYELQLEAENNRVQLLNLLNIERDSDYSYENNGVIQSKESEINRGFIDTFSSSNRKRDEGVFSASKVNVNLLEKLQLCDDEPNFEIKTAKNQSGLAGDRQERGTKSKYCNLPFKGRNSISLSTPIFISQLLLETPEPARGIGRSVSFSDKIEFDLTYQEKFGQELISCNFGTETSSLTSNNKRKFPITETLKRLMSSPIKRVTTSNASSHSDVVEMSTSTTELKRNKSIRQIGSSLVRKISRRGGSPTAPDVTAVDDGASRVLSEYRKAVLSATAASNGRMGGDPSLICYEELLKLFLCPGCQSLMTPPFAQCRKGHLLCPECKQQSKNACPTCKQRFADCTNLMMEQVG